MLLLDVLAWFKHLSTVFWGLILPGGPMFRQLEIQCSALWLARINIRHLLDNVRVLWLFARLAFYLHIKFQ